jgi:hypothetical protein
LLQPVSPERFSLPEQLSSLLQLFWLQQLSLRLQFAFQQLSGQ